MGWQDRGNYPRLCLDAMDAAGIDADAVCRMVGVDREQMRAPDFTYEHESAAGFWHAVEAVSGDADVGLRIGSHLPSWRGEVLEYLFKSSPDFGTGLRRMVAYRRLISDAMEGQVGEADQLAFIGFRSRSTVVNACRHLAECQTLGTLAFYREITADAFVPRRVELMCAAPADTALRQRLFGCPVSYGHDEWRVYFDRALLARPSPGAEPELFRVHDRIASERLQKIVARDFVEQVRAAIGSLLELGEVTLDSVSQQLQLPPADVRARLAAAGASFQQQLDDYRHRLACRLLTATAHSMQDICYLTGFSEPATFYRAFRRWEGDTPVGYRKRRHGQPHAA